VHHSKNALRGKQERKHHVCPTLPKTSIPEAEEKEWDFWVLRGGNLRGGGTQGKERRQGNLNAKHQTKSQHRNGRCSVPKRGPHTLVGPRDTEKDIGASRALRTVLIMGKH